MSEKAFLFLSLSIVVGCTILGTSISESFDTPQAHNWRIWGMIIGVLWIWGFLDIILHSLRKKK